ncbi:MAG: LysR substrate-binding domain-containing protein [Bermanella sp.]
MFKHPLSQGSYRSPPIQYLPAFVAAAFHNSFKLAATQLNVSPSAISQQIKTLETHIGLELFSRKKRTLELTRAGVRFYEVAKATVNHYEAGYDQFAEQYISPTLRVSMIPYIANEVIIPRLAEFKEQYPDINLLLQTSIQLENLPDKELDAAIRFGVPPWPEHDVALIAKAQSSLVASKEYLDSHPIKETKDWQQQTLIHSRTKVNDWQGLMDRFNFTPKQELFFDSYDASIRAAEEGLGISVAVFPISNTALQQKKIIPLAHKPTQLDEAFYLVTKPNENKQAGYQALLKWLKQVFSDL